MAELEGARALALTFGIEKVDEARREVWGIATAEVPDKQRDIVDFDASVRAFRAWGGNVREQHNKLKTVGKAIAIEPLPDQKAIRVGVFLSRSADGEDAWTKVREGILTGFSIGGTVKSQRPEIVKSEGFNSLPQTYNRITGYDLGELSLVDNPACPVAKFDLVKASAGGQLHATAILAKDDDGEAFRQPLRAVISEAENEEKQRILDDHSQPGVPASVRGITHGIDAHKDKLLNAVDGVLTKGSRRTTVAKVAGAAPSSVTFVGTQGLTATWGDGGNLVIEKAKQPSGGWQAPGAQMAPGGAAGAPGAPGALPDDDDEDEDDDAVAPGAIPSDADQPMPDNSGNPQSSGAAPGAPANPSSKTYDDGTENLDGPDNADQQPDQSSIDGAGFAGMPPSPGQPGAQGKPGAQGFGGGGDARDPHGSQWADSLDDDADAGGMPEGTIATHYTPESAQAHADALERGTGQAHDIVGDGDAFHVRPFPEGGHVTPDDIVGTHFSRDAAEDKRQKIESRGGFPAAVHQTPGGRYQVFPVPAPAGGAPGQVAPDGSITPDDGQQSGGSPAGQQAPPSAGQPAGLPLDPRTQSRPPVQKADVSRERRAADGKWSTGGASGYGGPESGPLDPHHQEIADSMHVEPGVTSRDKQIGDSLPVAPERLRLRPKWTPGNNTPDSLGRHNATYHGTNWDIHSFMRHHEAGTRDDPSVHYAITGHGEPHDDLDRREIAGAAASDLQDHFEGGNHFDSDVADRNPNHSGDWNNHVDNVADEAIEEHDHRHGWAGDPDGPTPTPTTDWQVPGQPATKAVENLMKSAQALTSRHSDQEEIAAVRDALLLLSRTLAKADGDAGVTAPKIPLYTKPRRNADGVDPDGYNAGGQHDAVSDDDEEAGQTVGASAGSQPGELSRPIAGSARTATVTKRAEAGSGGEWDDDEDPDAEHDMSWAGDGDGDADDNQAKPGPRMGKADDMGAGGYGQEAGEDPEGIDDDGDGDGEVNEAGGASADASADAGAMKGISARRLRSTIHTEVAKALAIDGPATQSLQKVVSTTVGNVLKAVLAGHEDRLSDIEKRSAALDAMDARLRAIEAQPMPSAGGPAVRAVEKSMGDLPGATGLERRIGEPRSGVIDRLRQRTLNKSDVSALETMLEATDGHDRQAIGNVLALQDLKNMYR